MDLRFAASHTESHEHRPARDRPIRRNPAFRTDVGHLLLPVRTDRALGTRAAEPGKLRQLPCRHGWILLARSWSRATAAPGDKLGAQLVEVVDFSHDLL